MIVPFDPRSLDAVRFPSSAHERLLRAAVARYERDQRVTAMVLTNSLARDVADANSDLDYAVFAADDDLPSLKAIGKEIRHADPDVEVHMAATALSFTPREMDVNDIDMFEIRIGNFLAHSRLMFDRDGAWTAARAKFLPYYDDALATSRESRFKTLAHYQAAQCRIAAGRGLSFEATQRIVHALQLFFACLFVRARKYPVDYLKRIEAQAAEMLGAGDAVREAQSVLAIDATDSATLARACDALQSLLDRRLGRVPPR